MLYMLFFLTIALRLSLMKMQLKCQSIVLCQNVAIIRQNGINVKNETKNSLNCLVVSDGFCIFAIKINNRYSN